MIKIDALTGYLLLFVVALNFTIQAQDLKIQHIQDDIDETGGTNTVFTSVSSTSNAFALPLNNRKTHAGSSTNTGTLNGDDMSGSRRLTDVNTLTYYREPSSSSLQMRFNTAIWEYTGVIGGPNEFIVRGRYTIDLNGTTNSTTQALAGITDANNCIPFITGIITDASSEGSDSGTAIAYLEDDTTLRVQKGSNGNDVSLYITLVEFTGANWRVHHGDSGETEPLSLSGKESDTGRVIIRANSDGTGAISGVSTWNNALIFSQSRSDNTTNGTYDSIADNWPIFEPTTASDFSNIYVDWTFNGDHDSEAISRHFIHVLEHSEMNVTRFTSTSNTVGESTIDVTSTGLSTDLSQSMVLGVSTSSGTTADYGKGWRNYYLNSDTEIAHWSHKAGNTMSHNLQVVDFSGIKFNPGGIDSNPIIWLKADEGVEEGPGDLAEDNDAVSKWKGNISINNYAEYTGIGSPTEPVFRDSEINFNPVVYFDGSADSGFTMSTNINGSETMTIFAVAQGTYPGSGQKHLINLARNTNNYLSIEKKTNTDELRFRYRNNNSGPEDIKLGSGEIVEQEPFLVQYQHEAGPGGGPFFNQIFCKGANITDTDTTPADILSGRTLTVGIGRDPNKTSRTWQGGIAELIVYDEKITGLDRKRVQSYLALKYGITLEGKEYLFGDIEVWDMDPDDGYNNDISGIGRDDDSGLNQKQSKTINTDDDITIGIKEIATNNKSNSNNFLKNESFLVWGNNNGNLTFDGANNITKDFGLGTSAVTNVTAKRIERIWKIKATDTIPTVKLSIPKSMVSSTNPGDVDEYIMIVADNDSFTTNVTSATMKLVGDDLEANFYFEGTKYITFGSSEISAELSRAASFDRSDSYISAGDVNDLNNKSFSLSAWIKRNTGDGKFDVISKRNYFNEDITVNGDGTITENKKGFYTIGYAFRINKNGNLRLVWRDPDDSSNNTLETTNNIPENEWHHVCATYDKDSDSGTGLGTTKLYIDGILVDSEDTNDPINFDNDSHFVIGAANHQDRQQRFNGSVDEVRVWNICLTANQIRYMMNQEIEKNGVLTNGKVLPETTTLNDIDDINWDTGLEAYYPMSRLVFGSVKDESNNRNDASMFNYDLLETQTAPLPYETTQDGPWDDSDTWLNGQVQYLPGIVSYIYSNLADGDPNKLTMDYNIVKINNNVTLDNSDPDYIPSTEEQNRKVLGLIINSGADLQVNGDTDAINKADKGNGLTISHYLKVDGNIDLEGESQLIQTENSDLDTSSIGTLERDQQGTKDRYTYNYWSSPVGKINTSVNNQSFILGNDNVLKNGTDPSNPNDIVFIDFNGSPNGNISGSQLSIASRWIWKYANNVSNNYSEWEPIGSTNSIDVGEGFTMKGVEDTGGLITTEQNYTFYGKPNNGDFSLTINAGNQYLIGNPYPSAIDADEFIKDNISSSDTAGANNSVNVINGALYFWDHFAVSSHALADYQGGYAIYTLMGGVVAVNNDTRIDATGALGTKQPSRYIPVGQGFFVSATLDSDLVGEPNDPDIDNAVVGGNIQFKNSQRIFKTEHDNTESIFMRKSNDNSKSTSQDTDIREKIRLLFTSPEGFHRQLLAGVDTPASDGFDIGYDGLMFENNIEDMFWVLNNSKLVVQAVNDFDEDQILPLGLKTNSDGTVKIKIDELENIDLSKNIYLHDKILNIYHDLKESDYEVFLVAGEYLDRFEVVFDINNVLSINDNDLIDLDVIFSDNDDSIIINNPKSNFINNFKLYNLIGQSILFSQINSTHNFIEYKTNNIQRGIYIITVKTNNGIISKKLIIK